MGSEGGDKFFDFVEVGFADKLYGIQNSRICLILCQTFQVVLC